MARCRNTAGIESVEEHLKRTCLPMLALVLSGCAITPMLQPANSRSFDFTHDTLAYANQLDWDYRTDFATGVTTTSPHVPAPSYSQHCIIMARTTRQFFQFARFEPARRKVDDETYRGLIREVVAHDPSETAQQGRIVIPGYVDLRSFSAAKE